MKEAGNTPPGPIVRIRPLAEGDLGRTLVWINTPEIVEAIGVSAPISKAQQDAWFGALQEDPTKLVFAICVGEDGIHVGNVSLRDIHETHRTAMFSIFIADDSFRGGGIGEQATRLCLQHAFEVLGLNRVFLKTTEGNDAAVRLYRKIGFQLEGRLRQHEFIGSTFVDKLLFGILAHEFSASEEIQED